MQGRLEPWREQADEVWRIRGRGRTLFGIAYGCIRLLCQFPSSQLRPHPPLPLFGSDFDNTYGNGEGDAVRPSDYCLVFCALECSHLWTYLLDHWSNLFGHWEDLGAGSRQSRLTFKTAHYPNTEWFDAFLCCTLEWLGLPVFAAPFWSRPQSLPKAPTRSVASSKIVKVPRSHQDATGFILMEA
jgi:hypothetical protein